MFSEYPLLASTVDVFTTGVLIVLAILGVLCLIRAILGPRVADRLVAVNMLGTMVMVVIGLLAIKLNEGFLADICIIYAAISFLAVIVGTKVYTGVFFEKMNKEEQ